MQMNKAARTMLANGENEEAKICYKVRTDSNRPCVRCEHAGLLADCPGTLALRKEAKRRGLVPIPIRWSKGQDGQLFLFDA